MTIIKSLLMMGKYMREGRMKRAMRWSTSLASVKATGMVEESEGQKTINIISYEVVEE